MTGNGLIERSGVLSTLAAVLVLSGAASPRGERQWAAEVLAAARGAPAILCGLAAHSAEGRFGSGPWTPPIFPSDTSGALAWALGRNHGSEADPVLLAGLAADDPCVRTIAARLIARTESPAVTAGLLQALAGQSPGTRSAAAVALGLAGIEAGAGPLVNRLRDTDSD
ncbi:MAG TPA: HEAT repeat domain-containing protein, partial [Gemmatimonadales bacterium]|nr:HEAT repeat domain-containing protein [Gemmatimonadales bacterium]